MSQSKQTMTMSVVSFLAASLPLLLIATSAEPVTTPAAPVDVRAAAKQLVNEVRNLAERARNGMYVDPLYQDVLDLQAAASDLIQQLPGGVSECETKSVIKMAAAGTGSHEVLTVLLADDILDVLNGRLSLSLAFLEHVAQQLEDELSLSDDVGAYLSAIVFGSNTTATIIETADKTVKTMTAASYKDNTNNRVRRQLRTSVNLGGGWDLGLGGLKWRSSSGRATFNLKPTFSGLRPNGARATFTFRF